MRVTVRLQEDEEKVLKELQKFFSCDRSKALRNALVLTKLFLDTDMNKIMEIVQEKYEIEIKPKP